MPPRGPNSGIACTSRRKGGCTGRMFPMHGTDFDPEHNHMVRRRECEKCGCTQRTVEHPDKSPRENPPLTAEEIAELLALEAAAEEQRMADARAQVLRDIVGDGLEFPVGEHPSREQEVELAELQSRLRKRMDEDES